MSRFPHKCPRCGGGIPNDECRGLYPGALSRKDNETEICSNCGAAEALEDFLDAAMEDIIDHLGEDATSAEISETIQEVEHFRS